MQCIKSGGYPLWPYTDCSNVFEADDDMTQPPNSVEPQEGRGSGMVQKQNQCLYGVPVLPRAEAGPSILLGTRGWGWGSHEVKPRS